MLFWEIQIRLIVSESKRTEICRNYFRQNCLLSIQKSSHLTDKCIFKYIYIIYKCSIFYGIFFKNKCIFPVTLIRLLLFFVKVLDW